MEIGKKMRIIDISREFFSSPLYPGMSAPQRETEKSIGQGDPYNETIIRASVHTATHCDSPLHFIPGGLSIDQLPLEAYIGPCHVIETGETMIGKDFLEKAIPKGCRRLLLKGHEKAFFTADAGLKLREKGIITIGTDALTIAPFDDLKPAHISILGAGIAVIEYLDLSQVEPGEYFLCALPLKISACDGSPVRAVLLY